MTELETILPLWRELERAGSEYVLATVVAVDGSSYRKPGARMLLAPDGRRAGTISGGCLEAEVARRAWWLTAAGPVVEPYSTAADDDGDRPFGSGCGGVVHLLLERRSTAGPLIRALQAAFAVRSPLAIATVVEGPGIGARAFAGLPAPAADAGRDRSGPDLSAPALSGPGPLHSLAEAALAGRASLEAAIEGGGRAWADYRRARPGLWIFSAGDDARPLVSLAREMGWFVTVADGRSDLAARSRFPAADEVRVLPIRDLPGQANRHLPVLPGDAAVVMTHSFEQDSRLLASLLALPSRPAYLGVLGPGRRTRELMLEAARLLALPLSGQAIDRWLDQLHAPAGLDLGGETPAAVALSILAEIQKALTAATGEPLCRVRRAPGALACS